MPKYLALDLHRDSVYCCRLEPDPKGAKIKRSRFSNTLEAWSQFIRSELDQETWVAFEVTGNAFEVHDLLSPYVGQVLLTKATAVHERGSGRKTDRVDTDRLVTGLANGTLPVVWVPPRPVRALRRLLRLRAATDSRRRAVANQIRAVLRRNWMPIPAGKDVVAWFEAHPEPLQDLPEDDRILVLSALRQVRCLAEEVEALTAEIARQVQDEPVVQRLLTIPGVSLLTAACIFAYLGDPARFPGPKQVVRYAGLDPSVHSSGETTRRGRITKHGCRPLRTALTEAAHVVARWDSGPLGQWFDRRRRQLGYNKAIAALARKLLVVAWRMMLTGESYRGARPHTTQRKLRRLQREAERARDWEALGRRLAGVHMREPADGVGHDAGGTRRKRIPVPA